MISTQRKKGTVHNDIAGRTLGVSINSSSFNPSSALCVHAELILLIVFNSNLHHFFEGGGSDESNKVEWKHCCDLRVCACSHMCVVKVHSEHFLQALTSFGKLYVSQDEGYPLAGQPQ